MFRRNFIQSITLAGAGGLSTLKTASAGQTKTVTYRIQGFTCITCAVGLDTMLRDQPGVMKSKSSYQEARTVIDFNPSVVTETSLKAFIEEMGFHAADEAAQ